jgi:uracil-DNA glycosylase
MIRNKEWNSALKKECQKKYYQKLQNFLHVEYFAGKEIYPASKNIYRALELVPLSKVKVVIVGQDPYINPEQADGLAFSVQNDKLPPSLKNIYLELEEHCGIKTNRTGNLEGWAEQGVLLLNTILTVERGKSLSHIRKGWSRFTGKILEIISESNVGICFVLWGNHAQRREKYIKNKDVHFIFKAKHPSPFSARDGFFGCNHFLEINEALKTMGRKEIDWSKC